MPVNFTSEFFRKNRENLRKTTDCDIIVVPANGLLQRGADSTYPFSQDANFWYLTGIDEPDLVLVIDGTDEYIFVPSRSVSREAFDGAVSSEGIKSISGISNILESTEGYELLKTRLSNNATIGIPAAGKPYIPQLGMYTNPARATIHQKIQEIAPDAKFVDLLPRLRQMRAIKQAPELAAIQQAIDITAKTLAEVGSAEFLEKQAYEYEIEAAISAGFRSQGATGHAFEPIVASGKRACTLHYVSNSGALEADSFIVMDVGAEVAHYAADITRTFVNGKISQRHRDVYAAVLDVHEYARNLLKPGVLLTDYEKQVADYMGQKLKELKLIDTVDHEQVRKYYPHATSHFLGLNVHDVGEYQQPLQADMVLTVEPGIYIPEEGIGIRIEDDIRITEDGIEILTDALARDLG